MFNVDCIFCIELYLGIVWPRQEYKLAFGLKKKY